jgi:hypothetical protein
MLPEREVKEKRPNGRFSGVFSTIALVYSLIYFFASLWGVRFLQVLQNFASSILRSTDFRFLVE